MSHGEMTKLQEAFVSKPVTKATIIPIDPKEKYVLLIDFGPLNEKLKTATKKRFMAAFSEWWSSDNPLYVIATFGGTLVLQKVSEEKPE